jgi:DNA repair exonuclease SbcCD ATPase subunit
MKIKRVIASDFGCLSGSYELCDDRANVIVESNERGKSTLVAAILAGLYGLPPSLDRIKLPEKETYQPWKGGSYRVALEVEDDSGRALLIKRDFAEGNPRVTDLSTNKDVTREFASGRKDSAIGDRLLGISREVFVKTCLVKQLEIEWLEKMERVQSKVEAIFDSSSGKGTAAEAIGVLQEAIRSYDGTRLKGKGLIETEISRLKGRIAEVDARMAQLTAERERVAPTMARLAELRKQVGELEAARQQLEYLSRRAEISEIESALKDNERNRRELDELIKRKELLKPYRDFTGEQASEFSRLVGQIEELRKRRKQLGESLDKLRGELEATKAKLKEFEGFESLDEDFKTRLHDVYTGLARRSEDSETMQKQLLEFKETLQTNGYDLTEIDNLSCRFSELTVEDKDLLRDSEARIPRIEADIGRLELAERTCREEQRAIRRPVKVLSCIALLFWAAAVVCAVLSRKWAQWVSAPMAFAGLGVVAAAFILHRVKLRKSLSLRRQQEAAAQERQSLLGVREMLFRALSEMAPKAGFESAPDLTEAFKRWGRLHDRAMRLESLREDAKEAEESVVCGKERASVELKKMGLHVASREVTLDLLQKTEKRLADYLETLSRMNQVEERCRTLEEEIEDVDRKGRGLGESIIVILTAAKLPQDLPVEEAAPKIEEARKMGEDFRRLSEEIPERERKLLLPEKVSEQKKRLESLKARVKEIVAEQPDLESLQPTKKHSEYEEEAREITKGITDNSEERGAILRDVQRLEDNYHDEYPRLANEAAELKETLDRTERFHTSISLATDTLQKISTKSHAQWASALNPRANEILRHLNPRCRELKFDRDLSFTVVPAEGEQPKDQKHIEAQQSVGARHQIYLAVRLALADYLSSAARLPVILDDPFATSDDDRFLSGMTFLSREYRRNHQVIILTCHRQRHAALIQERAPDIVSEIRFAELTSSAS